MEQRQTNFIQTLNTTQRDLDKILWLFNQAMELQGKNGYRVWTSIDQNALEKDIENGLQYKIVRGDDILCIFSIQHSDPFIWRERDQNDALYLHRIVVNPDCKGERLFEKVLTWAKEYARNKNLSYIRMDTWAENEKLIHYYKSFGFELVEHYTTPNTPELPIQNRELHIALLESTI